MTPKKAASRSGLLKSRTSSYAIITKPKQITRLNGATTASRNELIHAHFVFCQDKLNRIQNSAGCLKIIGYCPYSFLQINFAVYYLLLGAQANLVVPVLNKDIGTLYVWVFGIDGDSSDDLFQLLTHCILVDRKTYFVFGMARLSFIYNIINSPT